MRLKYAEVPSYRGLSLETDSIVRKTWIVSTETYALNVCQLVNNFIHNPDSKIVPVYDWQYFGRADHGYKYSYSMERMCSLSREEKTIIDVAGDSESRFAKDPMLLCAQESCEDLAQENPDLIAFLLEVIKDGKYHDLHSGNIMLDLDGNYKLIDLEGFLSSNYNSVRNKWFQLFREENIP